MHPTDRMVRALFIGLLLVHALVHVLGVVRGSRPGTAVWLIAALGFGAVAVLLAARSPLWWMVALPTVVVSELAIVASWGDAKWGTLGNVALLTAAALAIADLRPGSLRSRYERDVRELFVEVERPEYVTQDDLARVPPLVRNYLRRVGVVGQPRVHDLEVEFAGEIRNGVGAPWMKMQVEQRSQFGAAPVRLFFLESSRFGLPFDGYHRFVGPDATMEVTVLSLKKVVDARGREMNQSETVTLFNDMCLLAPATLLFADVSWEAVSASTVRATFRNAGQQITADLVFDKDGDLANFVSHDRYMSADGKTYVKHPWSTPVSDYREFGRIRVAAKGEAVWSLPEGHFVYARTEIVALRHNVAVRQATAEAPRLSQRAAIR